MLDCCLNPQLPISTSTSSSTNYISNCLITITEDLATFPIDRSSFDDSDYNYGKEFENEERNLKEEYLTLLGDRELSDASKELIKRIFMSFNSKVTQATFVSFMKNNFKGRTLFSERLQYKEEKNIIISAFGFLISQDTDITMLSYQELIQKYPEIAVELNFPTVEQKKYLENYYFYLQVILPLITKKTKGILIDVPSLLEGSGKDYICGTRQSRETAARVILATKLGGLVFHERPGDSNNQEDDEEKDNGSNSTDSSSTKRRKL